MRPARPRAEFNPLMNTSAVPRDSKHPARRLSHVARSSLLIAVFFGIDKLLGLFRQIVIGRQFGVSAELDIFNAANNLPDLLFALISGGALSVAFIPVLSERLELDGRGSLWSLFSRVANLAFLVTGGLAIVIAIFAEPLVRAEIGVAPGFRPEMQAQVVELMRLNLIATLIFSLSGLAAAGLQANQHFLLPALAPVVYDLGQIFGALVLSPTVGYQLGPIALPAAGLGIRGLVYGVILGAALHLGVQIPGLKRYRFRWTPRLGLDHPGVHKVLRLLGPRILTIGAFQLIFVVQDNLASRLNIGSVTALAYGWLIMQVPETIIGTAIGIAILPTLSEHFARDDSDSFERSLNRALRSILAVTLPAAGLMAIGIRPWIQVAFNFSAAGTDLVTWAARAYFLGLVAHSLLEVLARAFYARQNARTPLLATAVNVVVFVALSAALYRGFGAMGIALSNSLAFTVEAGLLFALLARMFPGLLRRRRQVVRIGLGTALGCLLTGAIIQLLPLEPFPSSVIGVGFGGAAVLPFIWKELRQLSRL